MKMLLRLLLPCAGRVAIAAGLGAIVVASNMGLLAAAAYLIAAASVTHLMAVLIIPMYAVRILSAVRGSARYAERLVSHRVTFDILARLRVRLFDRFRLLGPAGMQGTHSGDALRRVMADVDELQDAYLLSISPVAVALTVSGLLLGILLVFSRAMALATLCYLAAAAVALPLSVGLARRTAGASLATGRVELNAHLVDSIQGSRDILSNGAGAGYLKRTAVLGQRMARDEARLAAVTAGREGAAGLLTNLAMLTALALAIPLVARHAISALYVAVPALLVLAAFEAIGPLGHAAEMVSDVQAAGRRVLEITEGGPGSGRPVREPAAPVPLRPPYSVAFEGVTLCYADPSRPAVREVSFDVPSGTRVALVGVSGAGKTTLVRLLTRAWEPTAGRILVGGRDIRDYPLRDLRTALGVVAQDTYVFNDTVRNNLLLARPDASATDFEAVLHEAGLLELVSGLPRGLDTWIGEHGDRLSGGERQRLAVARVLLQDAPIIVLDEVTANLDPLTEHALLDMLHRVTEGRTVLAITHRLVWLDRMDEVVVLDRGRVIERGTHGELCAAAGAYRRMLDVQENMLPV